MKNLRETILGGLKSQEHVVRASGKVIKWDGKYLEIESSRLAILGWYAARPTLAEMEKLVRLVVGFRPYDEIREKLEFINSQRGESKGFGAHIGDWLVSVHSGYISFCQKI